MKNTNLLKSVSFLFFVICSTLQGWGESVTVGLTTSLSTTSGKGGTEVYSNGSNANLTVTKSAAGVGSGSDTIISYSTGDKPLYLHSTTAQYANFNYNIKKKLASRSGTRYTGYSVSVKSGYTFSLSSLSASIAASANMSWRVEIVNSAGTVVYSSGDLTISKYNDAESTNYSVTPDLSKTAACQNLTGTFYVRAYHWFNGTGKFWCYPTLTITGDVAPLAEDSYDIHIGKNNADYTDQSLTNTSGSTWSKTVTLDGGSYYEFKVKKTPAAGDAVWYGNDGRITATTSPAWDFSTSAGNCKLYTTVSGSYTFSWDTSTSKLTVTYPSGSHPTKRVYMACGSTTWCDASPKFYVHSWGVAEYNTEVQLNSCGDYYADIIWYNDYFQFTRNSSSATAYNNNQWNVSQDLTYSSSQPLWTCTGWSDSKGTFSSSAYSATRYSVTITPTNATKLTGTTGANAATCGTEYTATFRRNAGYNLPATVTVTIGGSSATSGTDYTWTQATGTLTIPGTKITGNIVVTLSGTTVTCPDGSSEETLFSAEIAASSEQSTAAAVSSAGQELTSSQATVSGGFLYVCTTAGSGTFTSKQSSVWYFASNANTNFFKVELDCALQAGDVISAYMQAGSRGLWFSIATSRPASAPTAKVSSDAAGTFTYTVQEDDGIEGESVFYIYRGTGNNTYFKTFTITRPESCDAGVPGNIIKGSASGGTGTINLTASGSPASGDTWYWQTSSSGTAKTNSTASAYAVSAAGTYYLRSYNSSADCWSFTYKSVIVSAADLLTAISPTLSYDDEVEVGGTINPTLTGNSGSGTVTYSLNSVSPAGSLTINASTGAVTGVTAGGTATVTATITANGNYAGGSATSGTITVPDGTCFKITDAGKNNSGSPKWSDKSNGDAIENTDIDGTITGGTVTYSGSSSLTGNDTHGIIFDNDNDELTITLSGSNALVAGSVITIVQHGNSGTNKDTGFKISGNSMSPATCNNGSTTYKEMTQTYTVVAADGVAGTNSFTIKWTGTNQVYLKSMTVTGCEECTPITPSLSYSKTTIWMDDAVKTATPTLTGYYGTPSISYASSDPTVVRVDNYSTGAITALKRGTATITATIGATTVSTTDYCGGTATCTINVKDMSCGWNVIAGVTATSKNAGTPEGTLIASSSGYGINLQDWKSPDGGCGTGGKIGGDNQYIYLTLKSGEYFKDGDKVIVNIAKVPDVGDSKLHIYDGTTTLSDESTMIGTSGTPTCGENEIVISNVPANTNSITLHRGNGPTSATLQNPYVISMKVKRYTCPDSKEFDAADNSNWSDIDNWIGASGRGSSLPTLDDRVSIIAPVEVEIDHATAKSVVIYNDGSTHTGKLTIHANKGLEVAGTISLTTNGTNSLPTRTTDLILESSSAGNATLIFDNSNEDKATVYMYSKGWTDEVIGDGGEWNWQMIGSPVTDATRLNDYYDGYMYKWNSGWVDMTNFEEALTPFAGYSATYPTTSGELHTYEIDGTLVATGDKSITIPANTSVMAVANSWTAPIYVKNITFTDCEPENIYIYNTGYNPKEGSAAIKGGDRFAAGTYHTVPINSSPYTGDSLIASMQGFFVRNKLSSAGSMVINYDDVVRPSGNRNINAGQMHAPKREAAAEPVVMKLYVSDSEHDDRVVLLERSDFSRGFDNGWDGEKFQVNAVKTAPRLFAINETGGKEAVSAIPEIEGTVIGFRPGTETNYTISFEYSGAQTFYLYDTSTGFTTLIDSESEYAFTSNGANEDARFVIARAPAIATGVEDYSQTSKVGSRKLLIDGLLYIERAGQVYTIEGTPVK